MKIVDKNTLGERKKLKMGGTYKKSKENMILKRKLKRILQSGNVNNLSETEFSTEDIVELSFENEDALENQNGLLKNTVNENFNPKEPQSKRKAKPVEIQSNSTNIKKKIKSRVTEEEETEMVKKISSILSKKKTLINKAIELTTCNKPDAVHKNKKTIDVNESIVSKAETFDPNLSLAQKIISNIEKKKSKSKNKKTNSKLPESLKPVSKMMSPQILDDLNYSLKPRKMMNQIVTYKHSVLELFGDFEVKDAVIPSTDIDFHNLDNQTEAVILKSPETVEDMCVDHYGSDAFNLEINKSKRVLNKIKPMSSYEKKKQEPKNYRFISWKNNSVIMIMKPFTKVYFCGKLTASVIRGSVEILGHKLDKNPQTIYSSPISSLLCFEYQPDDKIASYSNLNDYDQIKEQISDDELILLLEPADNGMTNFVSKYFTDFNVFLKDKFTFENVDQSVYEILQCVFFTELRRGLFMKNVYWENISECILQQNENHPSQQNTTLICGGKNAGKSTLLRYLVNRVISSSPVLVVDLDPGQPELTVSGLLSATVIENPLLGPNFTHITEPNRSLSLGLINISDNEERYMACVKDIFEYCKAYGELRIPWIINTMGFTGPIGLKILLYIMNIFKPTVLVEIKSNNKRNNFDMQLTAENVNERQTGPDFNFENMGVGKRVHNYVYHNLDPFQYDWNHNKSLCRNIEPKDERLLNTVAYFSQIAHKESSTLLEFVPFIISMDHICLAFNNVSVKDDYVYAILNGKMVALCHDDNMITQKENRISDFTLLPCYGYGIIRGVDLIQRKIYIITPVNSSKISSVNTLVYGGSLPDCHCMYISDLLPGSFIPYTASEFSENPNKKHLMMTPKRKFNPLRLLEMKSKS